MLENQQVQPSPETVSQIELPDAQARPGRYSSMELSQEAQDKLVQICTEFKKESDKVYQPKREKMYHAFSAYKQKFLGEGIDLLPIVGAEGADNDVETQRPKVYMPLIRQVIVQLYSQIKLTLHPTDNDFMRLKGKTEQAAEHELVLTEAFIQLIKKIGFTTKMGRFYLYMAIFGGSANYPYIDVFNKYIWKINSITNQYEMNEVEQPPQLDLKIFSPMNFSPDPTQEFSDTSKWYYSEFRKKQSLIDSGLYFNKDKLKEFNKRDIENKNKTAGQDKTDLRRLSDLNKGYKDIEDMVCYDLYYIPYVELEGREYRNMLCGVVEDQVLVRFFPNLAPNGANPVVYCEWRPDPESPLGDGPAEDALEIQRMINMLENYKLESLARNGNRWAFPYGTDIDDFFGIAGGAVYFDPTVGKPESLSGNVAEYGALQNEIGILKSEAQIVTGANQPFQGAATLDFQKTATELNIINEGAMTIMREVIEHAASVGLVKTLDLLRHMAGEIYAGESVTVRIDDEDGEAEFKNIDLALLASDDYDIEITSVNPTMGKQAQMEVFKELLSLASANPAIMVMLKANGWHLIKQIMQLAGIRDMGFAKSPYQIRTDVDKMLAQGGGGV